MDHMAQGPKVALAGGVSAAEFRNLRLEELPGGKAFLQEVTAGSQQLAAPVHTAHRVSLRCFGTTVSDVSLWPFNT